jgi:undecaprenyl-diphosphatase
MATQEAERPAGRRPTSISTNDRPEREAADDRQTDLRPWSAAAILGLLGFALVTTLVAARITFPFDQPLLDATKGLGEYMVAWRDLSDSANLPLIAVGVAIVGWLFWKHRRREALLVVVLLAIATAGSELVKQTIARPRPPGFANTELGVVYSYPSGHVLEAVTIYGIIAMLVWRSSLPRPVRLILPLLFIVNVVLVGIARVAVGAHYPSDVLGGLLAGIGVLAMFVIASEMLHRRETARAAEAPHRGEGSSPVS